MKIVFDNKLNENSGLIPLWGFALYLEQYDLLFDHTRSNG